MFRHITTRVSGLIILIAGLWGGLIPFIGPYFHFVLGPDQHWKWTTGRLWLNVLPGAVAALGGLILMGGGPRASGRLGALMALAAGIWFAVGPDVSMLWNHGVSQAGVPHGRHSFKRMLEFLTFHSGLGVLITTLAAYSLPGAATYVAGRRGRLARDAELAGAGAAVEPHHDRRVAERDGAAGAGAGAGAERVDEPAEPVNREPGTERSGVANEPGTERSGMANEPGTAPAGTAPGGADGGASGTAAAEPGTRRRGGLAGFFGRR